MQPFEDNSSEPDQNTKKGRRKRSISNANTDSPDPTDIAAGERLRLQAEMQNLCNRTFREIADCRNTRCQLPLLSRQHQPRSRPPKKRAKLKTCWPV